MALNAEEEAVISQMFEAYIAEYHHGDIELIAASSDDSHQPVVINAMTLFEANMEIGDYFNAYPNDVLTIFDNVLHKTACKASMNSSVLHLNGGHPKEPRMKNTIHARITGLPVCPELTKDTIPRSRDVGHFLSVSGTVIRTSVAKVLEYERDYMCAKCRHIFSLQADLEQFYCFVTPVACPNPDGCNSCKFSCLSEGSEPTACRDYQEIKIQEQVQRLSVSSIPRSMVVVLEDDLVDKCKSGDDVTIYGVMCQRWKPFYDASRCNVELFLKANNIEVNNQQGAASLLTEDVQKEFKEFWESYKCDPIAGRNQILLSLCPQVFGMYVIKLAVAMVLAGGVQRIDSSGIKTRGECHMLLVGDPGTGKSQFLKYAAKMMPRSVLTAGIGSTSAGLTVAAVKDGGDWHLEAGALVLSDGGLCCIDEFNSIKEHDRISIHEAMEQQSISVAKAGMVCKLNTRTTILAATNPKSQYDPNVSLSVNVALASPLLSRFDLVLVLLDNRNKEWDRIISSFILEDRGLPSERSTLWSMEKMKAYFCVIKHLQPQVSAEATSILSRYYQLQRKSEGRSAARTTIRMLESLSRLAEAHARLMYRETVTIEDAVIAISVMECSMQGGGLLGRVNAVLTSFPEEPGQQYRTQCQLLLGGLNLHHLLQKEMDRLASLGKSSSMEASGSEQPADRHHHCSGEVDSITRTQSNVPKTCISDAEQESGLDWFYSFAPFRSSNEITSPVLSSTQKTHAKMTNTTNFTVKNNRLNTVRNVTVTSEESGAKHPATQENLHGSDSQHAQPPESVIQKVSKLFQERGVKELQCELQQVGKGGIGLENSQVIVHKSRKNVPVTDASSDIDLGHGDQSGQECHTTTQPVSAVLQDNIASSHENISFKFSDFRFQPKKMRSLVNNDSIKSDVTAPECNLDSRNTAGRDLHQKVGSHNTASRALTDTLNRKSKTHQKHSSVEGESMKKQLSCVSNRYTLCYTPEKPDKDKTAPAQTGSTVDQRDDIDRSKNNFIPLKPTSSPTNSTVASSTLAKLSRFSFSGATEPRPTLQMDLEKNPAIVETSMRKIESVKFFKSDSDKQTEERPKTMEIRQKGSSCPNIKLPCILEHGPVTSATSNSNLQLTEPTPARIHNVKSVNGRARVFQNPGKMKRKCFELEPSPTSVPCGLKAVLFNSSLFGSADLNDDVVDTDWDKEVAKKAKVG